MNPSVVCSVGSFFHGRALGRRTGSEHSSGQSSAQSVGYAKELGRQHDHVRGKSKEMRSFQRVMTMSPAEVKAVGRWSSEPSSARNPFGILRTILVLVGMNIRFGLNSKNLARVDSARVYHLWVTVP